VPEQINAAHILVAVKPDGGPNADEVAKAKAETIAARARVQGADFAKLANENTDDPSGKTSGGQLPPFSRGQMVPEFEAQAFAMEPGEIRGPIKTQFGYHVIKLNGRTPARTRSLERGAAVAGRRAVRAAGFGRGGPARPRARREAEGDVVGLRRGPPKAPERRGQPQHHGVGGEGRPDTGHRRQRSFPTRRGISRSARVSSTPITTARGVAFVKASEERAERTSSFAELKPRLEQDWKTERREKDALAQLGARRQGALGRRHARVARDAVRNRGQGHDRVRPGGPVPEIGAASELAAAVFKTPQGQAGPPVAVPNGFVLFRVLTRTEGSRDALQAQKEELRDSSAPEGGAPDPAILQKVRAAGVEVNDQLRRRS
jgi:hypothetical protein